MSIEAVQAKMAGIRRQLADIQQVIDSVRTDFESVIKDKSIPLADRWDLYCDAPEELHGSNSYIWRPESLKSLGHHGWEHFTYPERYMTVDLIDVISDMIDLHEPENSAIEEGGKLTLEILLAFIEEILECNIASFTYDW